MPSSSGPRIVGAILLVVALALAAAASWATNVAYRQPRPGLPLGSVITPVAMVDLEVDAFLAEARKRPDPSLTARAHRVARGVPLAAEPFLYAAMPGSPEDSGTENDARLWREAVRRDSRSVRGRYMVMRHEIARENLNGVVAQLVMLNRLAPGQADTIATTVGTRIETTAQADDTVEAFRAHPNLLAQVVKGYVQQKRPAALTLHLARGLQRGGVATEPLLRQLSGALVAGGDFGAARQVASGQFRDAGGALVNDPSFEKPDMPPPFGWARTVSNVGAAEVEEQGTLLVDFYGRRPGPLLRQLVTLSPGTYRLVAKIEGASSTTGTIDLEAVCAGSERLLASQTIDVANGRKQTVALQFTVPAEGCGGQQVGLTGAIGRRSRGQTMRVFSIDVTRDGA